MNETNKESFDFIHTGSMCLDSLLSSKGVQKGTILEIFGSDSTGKTTLALHLIAEIQRKKGTAAFIDAEHALNIKYASSVGVDTSSLFFNQPENGEQALQIAEILARSNAFDIIVIDTVTALSPKADLQNLAGNSNPGTYSKLILESLKKLAIVIKETKCTIVFISHAKIKYGALYGTVETAAQNNDLKLYASTRIHLMRTGTIKENGCIIGTRIKAKIVKSEVSTPFQECEIEMLLKNGICKEYNLISFAIKHGIIICEEGIYYFNGIHLGLSQKEVAQKLKEDSHLYEKIYKKAILKINKTINLPYSALNMKLSDNSIFVQQQISPPPCPPILGIN